MNQKVMIGLLSAVLTLVVAAFALVLTATASPAQENCTRSASLIDVTTDPTVTAFGKGQDFNLKVRLKNTGTCSWTRDYRLAMTGRSSSKISGDFVVRLPRTVAPGENVTISPAVTAPTDIGEYSMTWELQSPYGIRLTSLNRSISVKDIAGFQYMAQGFNLASPCTPDAALVSVDTEPDSSSLTTGQAFAAVVKFRNTGTCSFDDRYRLVNTDNMVISGPRLVWLAEDDISGTYATFSIPLTASTTPGNYRDVWTLAAFDGSPLSKALIEIDVIEPPAATEIVNQSPAPQDSYPAPAPEEDYTSSTPCIDAYKFVTDITVPDGTIMAPGEHFTKVWRYRNEGTCTWGDEYRVSFYSGTRMNSPASFQLPDVVLPGETVDIAVDLVAPAVPGKYKTRFQLHAPDGGAFSINSRPFVEIVVAD